MHFAPDLADIDPDQFSGRFRHGSVSARRAGRHHQRRQPDGHRRLRVRRIRAPEARRAARAVQADGLCAGRPPQDQEDHGLSPGRHQLSRQRGARHPRPSASSPRTGPARRRWRFAWSMRSRPMRARCRSVRSPPIFLPRRRRSTFPPSRASAAACSISSIATAPRARPMTSSSNGWARRTRGPRARGCITSITSPTTSIAAAWMSGPASTKSCSTSARSASSTSRAARPACSPAR